MSNRIYEQRRSALKGVALIEQHPAGPFIKGVFPANLLMEKSRLSTVAVKLWTMPYTESLSEKANFTYALFDDLDALCAAVFYEDGEEQYVVCAFFEASQADFVWTELKKVKEILHSYTSKFTGSTKNITKYLVLLYGELMKLFSK